MSAPHSAHSTTSRPGEFDRADRSALLALARHTIAAGLGRPAPGPVDRAVFATPRGAFVTVHVKGELRGCIGIPEVSQPLGEIVVHCAGAAAFEDPRFPSITDADLEALDIQISVLTPLVPVRDVSQIEIGRHGLVVEQGWHRGLLLPQVATEHGWSPTEFLRQTCRKAGLPGDAWQRGAQLWMFEAEVFSDRSELARLHGDESAREG
jgi:AmmeMemoRadiSam system protein A